jgi:hypothetical protein
MITRGRNRSLRRNTEGSKIGLVAKQVLLGLMGIKVLLRVLLRLGKIKCHRRGILPRRGLIPVHQRRLIQHTSLESRRRPSISKGKTQATLTMRQIYRNILPPADQHLLVRERVRMQVLEQVQMLVLEQVRIVLDYRREKQLGRRRS